MQAGMFGKTIAYNEHRVAPALTVLARAEGAEEQRRANRNAARRRRQAGDALPGHACTAKPRRLRAQVRSLQREIRALMGKPGATSEHVTRLMHKLHDLVTMRKRAAGRA